MDAQQVLFDAVATHLLTHLDDPPSNAAEALKISETIKVSEDHPLLGDLIQRLQGICDKSDPKDWEVHLASIALEFSLDPGVMLTVGGTF